jgi:thiamine pyrophosphate-dependent acetolactate synthase large subunit-like protein
MKVYEAIASALVAEGCQAAFGLIGDGNLSLWSALNATGKVAIYSARHEAGAVAMADGYHRGSGRLGLAIITCGPGLTQIGTSLAAAVRNRSSVVLATGDVPVGDKNNIQKMDQRRFAEACGAIFVPVTSTGNLAREVADACYAARVRRLPVVLNMPMDIQDESLEWTFDYAPSTRYLPVTPRAPDRQILEPLVQKLLHAKHPVIIAGFGAKQSGAHDEIVALADLVGALLATTLKAKGFFAGHEYDVGIAGAFSSAPTERLLADADFVLGIGAELGFYTTEGGLLFPNAELVRIDVAPAPDELGIMPGMYVCGDAKETVAVLLKAVAARRSGGGEQGFRGFRGAGTRDVLRAVPPALDKATDGMDPRALAMHLSEVLPENVVLTIGAGHYWSFFIMYTSVPRSADLYFSYQLGAIGQTVPMAAGIGVAHRGRPHLVLDGDGSVMMNIQELETIARHGIALVLLIWNDVGYGAEVHKLRAKGFDAAQAQWPLSPDFVTVARAFGGDGMKVEKEADIADAIKTGFAHGGLYVIDARVSRSVVSDPYLKLQFGVENRAPLLRPIEVRA